MGWLAGHSTRVYLAICGVALVLAVTGAIALQIVNNPGPGIPRDRAITLAWQHADAGAVTVISAEVKRGVNTPHHEWTWVVTFSGQWQLLCQGGDPETCNPTREWVAIDYRTGEWIASQHSVPAPH